MDQANFTEIVDDMLDSCRELLVVKGGEYAGSEDRLANFKRGAELVGVTPLQCLFVYMSKHYDAVATYVRDEASGMVRPRSEAMSGRLQDLINYCLLAQALIAEKTSNTVTITNPSYATYPVTKQLADDVLDKKL